MKKLFFVPFFIFTLLFGSDSCLEIEKKIYSKIAHGLCNKDVVSIFFIGKNIPSSLQKNSDIKIVKNIESADLVIVSKGKKEVKEIDNIKKPVVVLDYSLLKVYKMAVGAYFWQKSRPNIVIITPRIQKFDIKLPKEFRKFEESKVW